MIQVETTCHNRAEAEALAKRILRARLAACVQLGEIASFYHWEGALEEASEVKLSIKTRAMLYPTLEKFIREHHSYSVPQITATPITNLSPDYQDWLEKETGHPDLA